MVAVGRLAGRRLLVFMWRVVRRVELGEKVSLVAV